MMLCVLIGAFTHLFLDSFTHAGMWATERWPALGQVVSGYAIYGWLQLATSIIGLGLIAWALVLWWQRTPATNPATNDHALLRAGVALALVLISGIAALVTVVVRYGSQVRAAELLSASTLELLREVVITGALRFIAVATHLDNPDLACLASGCCPRPGAGPAGVGPADVTAGGAGAPGAGGEGMPAAR